MAVVTQNFLSGTLTADPGLSGTTLNSAKFADMVAIAAPDYMWIVLDPRATGGDPELVKVTAHTAASTSCTVVRAQQGSAARSSFSVGTAWANTWTDRDIEDIVNTPRSGFRNAIINGGFDIWQRGGGAFTTAGLTADRWGVASTGSTFSISRQSFAPGNAIAGQEPAYFYRNIVTSSAGAGNFVLAYQTLESVRSFAGQTVTVSFWAKADATKKLASEFRQVFGTGGSPTATVFDIGVNQVTLSTSWQRFSYTVAIPSISGATLGTNGDDTLRLSFWFDAGSTFNSRTNSMGQQSGTFDIWGVQIEPGPVETPFERRPISAELAMCQRFYYRVSQTGSAAMPFAYGFCYSTTAVSCMINFPVPMRIAPTAIDTTGTAGNYSVYNSSGGAVACNSVPTLTTASPSAAQLSAAVASGLVAGNGSALFGTASANAYLGFTADL